MISKWYNEAEILIESWDSEDQTTQTPKLYFEQAEEVKRLRSDIEELQKKLEKGKEEEKN